MENISRRKLMKTSLGAPLLVAMPVGVVAPHVPASLQPDPLVARAAAWMVKHASIDVMEREWQDLEDVVFDKAKRLKLGGDKASKSSLPEAVAMRALNRKIMATYKKLEDTAERMSMVEARTLEGAVAKIELGLRAQGAFDWRPGAMELIEGGIADFRRLWKEP